MSQRKKRAYRNVATNGGARPTAPDRYGRRTRGRDDSSRRTITFAIIVGGILVATWVLLSSLNLGSGASPSQQAGQPSSLDSSVAPLLERLRRDPADVTAMISLGNAYYDASQWTESIPWYEKALETVPKNTDVRTDLGTAYFYSGNSEKAKEVWFKVLEQDPNKVQTHFNLGILYSNQTPPDTDAAAKEWETVIKLAPNSENAKAAEQRLKALGKR